MKEIGLLGLFCGIAVSVGMLIALQLIKQKSDGKFFWLGLMFVAIALRVSKSIWYFILFDVASVGLALGFLGLSTIGPALSMTLKGVDEKSMEVKHYLHFLIPLSGFIACFFLDIELVTILYKSATAILFCYGLWGTWIAVKSGNLQLKLISLGVLGIAGSFAFQHLSGSMLGYAWGAAIAGVILVYFSYQGFNGLEKERRSNKEKVNDQLLNLVRDAFELEQVYLNRDLTAVSLAYELKIPPYQVPRIVKRLYNKSFPDTVASFRINRAADRLEQNGEYIKMDVLALECGFKSTSSFYSTFKRIKGDSPKEYQRSVLLSEPKSTSLDLATT